VRSLNHRGMGVGGRHSHTSLRSPTVILKPTEMQTTPTSRGSAAKTWACAPNAPRKPGNFIQKYDKMESILLHTFRLNDSGSKVVSFGLDPRLGFGVAGRIARPGETGTTLSGAQLRALMTEKVRALEFFAQMKHPDADIEFPCGLRVRYDRSWSKAAMIKLSTAKKQAVKEDDDKQFVAMTSDTWGRLVNLERLLFHVIDQLEWARQYVVHLYESMLTAIKPDFANAHPDTVDINAALMDAYDNDKIAMLAGELGEANRRMFDADRYFFEVATNCTFMFRNAFGV
jgi:hypothetical protein